MASSVAALGGRQEDVTAILPRLVETSFASGELGAKRDQNVDPQAERDAAKSAVKQTSPSTLFELRRDSVHVCPGWLAQPKREDWWAATDSNRRPSRCKRDALTS